MIPVRLSPWGQLPGFPKEPYRNPPVRHHCHWQPALDRQNFELGVLKMFQGIPSDPFSEALLCNNQKPESTPVLLIDSKIESTPSRHVSVSLPWSCKLEVNKDSISLVLLTKGAALFIGLGSLVLSCLSIPLGLKNSKQGSGVACAKTSLSKEV